MPCCVQALVWHWHASDVRKKEKKEKENGAHTHEMEGGLSGARAFGHLFHSLVQRSDWTTSCCGTWLQVCADERKGHNVRMRRDVMLAKPHKAS